MVSSTDSCKKYPTSILVFGLPDAEAEKIEKMKDFFSRKLAEKGVPMWKSIDLFTDDNGSSKGVAILHFDSESQIRLLMKELDAGFKFGKNNITYMRLDEAEQCLDESTRTENFDPHSKLNNHIRDDFYWWLKDDRCREQLLLRHGDTTEIQWHDPNESNPQIVYDGDRERRSGTVMTNGRAEWSSTGAYLVTLHAKGIALWAGDNVEKKTRLEHAHVRSVRFSPNDEYVLTWNGSTEPKDTSAIRLYNVQTGTLIRTYACPLSSKSDVFPCMYWSSDSKYIACITKKGATNVTALTIYSLPTGDMLKDAYDNTPRSIVLPELRKLSWCPTSNQIAVWCGPYESQPSKVSIIDIPSRREIATKNVYKAVDCNLFWHSTGNYLAAEMSLTFKSGKISHSQLELFRLFESKKGVPIETFRFPEGVIRSFTWETVGVKFAFITDNETPTARLKHVHVCSAKKDQVEILCDMQIPYAMNKVLWSPLLSQLTIAGLTSQHYNDGPLYFCMVHENSAPNATTGARIEILNKSEHFLLNYISYDPSGRYVLTGCLHNSSALRHAQEAGYAIWSFQGKLLMKLNKERLTNVAWRPHCHGIVNDALVQKVKKELKTYAKKFELQDENIRNSHNSAFMEKRKILAERFQKIMDAQKEWKKSHPDAQDWEEAVKEDQDDKNFVVINDIKEEIVSSYDVVVA